MIQRAVLAAVAVIFVIAVIAGISAVRKRRAASETEADTAVENAGADGAEAPADDAGPNVPGGGDAGAAATIDGMETANLPAELNETLKAAESLPADQKAVLYTAVRQAAMYDYDAAVGTIKAYDGYEAVGAMTDAVQNFEAVKATCISYDTENVPHVFYHSLLNDDRGFIPEKSSDFIAKDNGCWMCSVNEFNVMTQQMYEHGCVLIHLHDLVVSTVDENGNRSFTKNTELRLPPGKTPVILSEDDLSYYHAYDNQGIASKLILDENGDLKCEYTDEAGELHVGNYDVVPLLNEFIDRHPDFSYHNAHEVIALTGYNGVFGYRTDSVYQTRDPEHLDENQRVWLDAHPDFNFEEEVAEATKIADALKAEGYELASHTWGHRNARNASAESLAEDNEKWMATVAPITGPVDTIIFAHGADIAGPEDYTPDNPKFTYFKNAGYDFYCNVDGSTPVWCQLRTDYVRSARIDLDGYRLYQAMIGNENSLADLAIIGVHDVESFFDYSRVQPVEIMG